MNALTQDEPAAFDFSALGDLSQQAADADQQFDLHYGAAQDEYLISCISNIQKGIAAVQAYKAAAANAALSASEQAAAMSTASATAAQYGFNAALLSCPLTWVIVGIIAVVAAIYLIVAAINNMTGSAISATGIIWQVHFWLQRQQFRGCLQYLPYEEHTDRAELQTVRSCGGICRRLCAVCWRRIVI